MESVTFSAKDPISDALFAEFLDLMHEAFPISERRTDEEFSSLRTHPNVQLLCTLDGEHLRGAMLLWRMDEFVFVENFATHPAARNQGLGSAMLNRIEPPCVLEVEPPEDELTRRRVGFYRRNGFVLNEYEYYLPCLNEETERSPQLFLMSRPEALTPERFEAAKNTLYSTVYKGKPIKK